MKAKILGVLTVAFAVFPFVSLAHADTITVNNVQFTGTVTSNSVTLQIQCMAASCSGWYIGDVTLKGFTFTGDPTGPTAPSGYLDMVQNGGQDNNGVGNGGGCNGGTSAGMGDLQKAVCWDAVLPLTTQLGNGVLTFTANITNGSVSGPLHVQATAYTNQAGDQTMGGKPLAVSVDLVPEPGTLVLFGSGLLALGVLLRRRAIPYSQV